MEDGLVFLAWLSFEFILLYTGKAVISTVSFGHWRGEQIAKKEGRIYSAAGSLSFIRDGRRVITVNGLFFSGLSFYVALIFLLVYLI